MVVTAAIIAVALVAGQSSATAMARSACPLLRGLKDWLYQLSAMRCRPPLLMCGLP